MDSYLLVSAVLVRVLEEEFGQALVNTVGLICFLGLPARATVVFCSGEPNTGERADLTPFFY